ncbi:MAG: hypothetical protein IKZ84_13875 [Victivallales bacterium]|nr:hypothetical protein [Victivallales bacterium]
MSQENLAMVLAAYQRRKNLENMVAPLISICIHILVALGLLLFYKPAAPQMESAVVEVKMQEEEIKEIEDEKVLEELDKLEQQADEQPVPQTEIPEVVAEQVAEISEDFGDPDLSNTNDEAMDFSDALDIKANDTPLKISALYEGRSTIGRMNALKKAGGNQKTESAVLRALRWLKKTQNDDGSWTAEKDYKEAITGLCLLAYLAHGETPTSEEFGVTVQKSMQYLADRVNANALPKGNHYPYINGIVAYALAEAYGMTKIPFLRPPMENALQVLMDGQQSGGGYDYNYKQEARWDLSVAGWQYQAMKAGFVAGANVKDLSKGMEKGVSFIRNVSYKKPHSEKDRPFGYSTPGGGSDGMQGAAVLCLQLLGEGNCPEAKAGIDFIDKIVNNSKHSNDSRVQWRDDMWKNDLWANPMYYWYYCTQAMFHAGQRPWKEWNDHFSPMCIAKQNPEGYWDSPGAGKKNQIDKWYTTALCALSLQVYYRYLPTYKMPKQAVKVEKTTMESLDDDLGLEL